MKYGSIFREALKIFWQHKSLWVFGIVITLFGHNI